MRYLRLFALKAIGTVEWPVAEVEYIPLMVTGRHIVMVISNDMMCFRSGIMRGNLCKRGPLPKQA